jgi:hypothetical protein
MKLKSLSCDDKMADDRDLGLNDFRWAQFTNIGAPVRERCRVLMIDSKTTFDIISIVDI